MQSLITIRLVAILISVAVGTVPRVQIYDQVKGTWNDKASVTTEPPINPSDVLFHIKMEQYSNPSNMLLNGQNCDLWGWSKCDFYATILYSTTINGVVSMKNLTTAPYNNVDAVPFGLYIGFPNPIILRAPIGAVIDVLVTAFDDDDIGSGDETIGIFPFQYLVGAPKKNETKTSGTSRFTVSFY